jgi:hypothetical protein
MSHIGRLDGRHCVIDGDFYRDSQVKRPWTMLSCTGETCSEYSYNAVNN